MSRFKKNTLLRCVSLATGENGEHKFTTQGLTIGNTYRVVIEAHESIYVMDDFGDRSQYWDRYFELIF